MIADLLYRYEDESILFVSEPGCGKTTLVREVTRRLAEEQNVCIVDTSNEIAGDGDVTHPCVGHARRLVVPSLDKQAEVMIKCVQNHTPRVMVGGGRDWSSTLQTTRSAHGGISARRLATRSQE